MKSLVDKFATRSLTSVFVAACFFSGIGVSRLPAQADGNAVNGVVTSQPTTPGGTLTNVKANKKPKKNRRVDEATPTPHAKGPKEIPFPLPVGEPANDLKIPETDLTGQLISQIVAARATRIDNEHVQMKEMKMDLNHPDGKEDFHVILPTSVFNLKTRIITSEDEATVRTQDFELTGEAMEFNTVDRTGRLLGKVRMLIHNLKQVAGQAQPTPKPE